MTAFTVPQPHSGGHRRRHRKDAQLDVWFMTGERPGRHGHRRSRHGRHGQAGFGFGGPLGPGRRAGRGDIRAAILTLLAEEPMHGYQIIQELAEVGEPMIITQNGEAKAVIQDIVSYEQTQETLALLKILALAERNIAEGRYQPAKGVFRDLRKRLKAAKSGS